MKIFAVVLMLGVLAVSVSGVATQMPRPEIMGALRQDRVEAVYCDVFPNAIRAQGGFRLYLSSIFQIATRESVELAVNWAFQQIPHDGEPQDIVSGILGLFASDPDWRRVLLGFVIRERSVDPWIYIVFGTVEEGEFVVRRIHFFDSHPPSSAQRVTNDSFARFVKSD